MQNSSTLLNSPMDKLKVSTGTKKTLSRDELVKVIRFKFNSISSITVRMTDLKKINFKSLNHEGFKAKWSKVLFFLSLSLPNVNGWKDVDGRAGQNIACCLKKLKP